jgi:hypothetical protein
MNYNDKIMLMWRGKDNRYIVILKDGYKHDGSAIIEGDTMERVMADVVRADDRWVTINGSHVLISKNGCIAGGMGGKFNGFPFGARFSDKGDRTPSGRRKIARLHVTMRGGPDGNVVKRPISQKRLKVRNMIKKYRLKASGDIRETDESKWRITGPASGLKIITQEEKDFLKKNKSLFFDELGAYVSKKAKHNRDVERVQLASIKGIDEIQKAKSEWERYSKQVEKAAEYGDVKFPKPPNAEKPAVLAAKFPRATAYLQMEAWENSSNYVKSEIGRKARKAILNGRNYNKVVEEAKKQWSDYTQERAWD